jgi:hypothetical protein
MDGQVCGVLLGRGGDGDRVRTLAGARLAELSWVALRCVALRCVAFGWLAGSGVAAWKGLS